MTTLASTTTLDLPIQVVEDHKGHHLTLVLALLGHRTTLVVRDHQLLTPVYNRPAHTLVPKAHQVDTQGLKVPLEVTQDHKAHQVVIPVHKDHQVITQAPKVRLETIQGILDPVLVHRDLLVGQVGLGTQDQVPLHPILDQGRVVRDIRQVDQVGRALMEVVIGEDLPRSLTENISRLEIN